MGRGGGAEGRTQRARWSLMEPYGALRSSCRGASRSGTCRRRRLRTVRVRALLLRQDRRGYQREGAKFQATAGRKFPDVDLDTRKADISALLSRDQPVFVISESAIFV